MKTILLSLLLIYGTCFGLSVPSCHNDTQCQIDPVYGGMVVIENDLKMDPSWRVEVTTEMIVVLTVLFVAGCLVAMVPE